MRHIVETSRAGTLSMTRESARQGEHVAQMVRCEESGCHGEQRARLRLTMSSRRQAEPSVCAGEQDALPSFPESLNVTQLAVNVTSSRLAAPRVGPDKTEPLDFKPIETSTPTMPSLVSKCESSGRVSACGISSPATGG